MSGVYHLPFVGFIITMARLFYVRAGVQGLFPSNSACLFSVAYGELI